MATVIITTKIDPWPGSMHSICYYDGTIWTEFPLYFHFCMQTGQVLYYATKGIPTHNVRIVHLKAQTPPAWTGVHVAGILYYSYNYHTVKSSDMDS